MPACGYDDGPQKPCATPARYVIVLQKWSLFGGRKKLAACVAHVGKLKASAGQEMARWR